MANLGRGAFGVALRTGSLYTGVGGQNHELCRGDTGQVLTVLFDGTLGWTDVSGVGAQVLNDLLDVNVPDPKQGDCLCFNGTEWVAVRNRFPAWEFYMAQL